MNGRAEDIKKFLEWASEQDGRHETYLNEGGYVFHRSVSVYGSHDYEFPEDKELDELITRYVEETS